MENKSLVSMESVKCERLEKLDQVRGRPITIEALVQGFSDGSTRVLCDELEEGKCKKKEGELCFLAAEKTEG